MSSLKSLEKLIPKTKKRKRRSSGKISGKRIKYSKELEKIRRSICKHPKELKKQIIPYKQTKFVIPSKLKKNIRFRVHQQIKIGISKIPNIFFNGRVHSYINSDKQKKKVKELGYTSGLCQISVFNPIKNYKGFHLLIRINDELAPLTELKVLANFYRNGYAIGICKNSRDGIKLVKYYIEKKHKKMNTMAFKGKIKLEQILRYDKIYSKKTKLRNFRKGEYKIQSECPNKIISLNKEIVIDGQPQGNTSRYYNWLGSLIGYNKGACDMFLWITKGKYNGFAAEFKYGRNKTQSNQDVFITKLKSMGWYVCEPRSSNEMIEKLNIYLIPSLHYSL